MLKKIFKLKKLVISEFKFKFIHSMLFIFINWIIIIKINIKKINIFNLNNDLNNSLEAILDTYMNKTNNPPKKVNIRIYENQYVLIIIPDNKQVNMVCNKIINPIVNGLFKNNIIIEIEINLKEKIIFIINSKSSLNKIIILEIIDKDILFLWSF